MKGYTRTLVRDIKAAARIGHIESLWVAMDSLAEIPEVKGNHPLSETFLHQVILPVAEALSGSRVSKPAIQPLLTHPKTGIRAASASALALRFLKGNGTTLKDLQALAKEPRKEVREAVALACQQAAPDYPDTLNELVEAWLGDSSPRLQAVAIRLLSGLPSAQAVKRLKQLTGADLPNDPEVRASMAEAINALGQAGCGEEAVGILRLWAGEPETFYWPITQCLAKGWAAEYPKDAMEILTILARVKGPKKKIRNALQAFLHNGVSELVRQTIQAWQSSDNPDLSAAGEDAYLKLIQPTEKE